jgi:uncharacterized DUF497 family protein
VLIFEWDPENARDNEQKHGVSFLEASDIFDDDHSSSVPDPDHSADEDRYLISVFLNRVGIWLCPILSAETEFG